VDSIAVGLVFHRAATRSPIRSERGLDVLVRTNAADGERPTSWLGFGANHNLLLREAGDADWYVALNPDVAASADDIKRLIDAAEGAGIDVAGPLLDSPWGVGGPRAGLPGPRQWLRETFGGARRAGPSGGTRVVRGSAWVSGACIALRLDRPEARFDEDYFMYFEDAALCHRVAEAGGRVGVCEEVLVSHRSGWSEQDPLRWRRGVEFARSALRFAEQTNQSLQLMRAAGVIRFGSRRWVPGRSTSEHVGARAIARGFVRVRRAPGLRELAADFNAGRGH
jgi:GT2 family glycosyltransferase